MRRLMMAAAAIGVLAGAGMLFTSGAQAFPAASSLSEASVGQVENVALICPRPVWNGWRWIQPACYRTRPAFVAPYAYVAPPPVVVVRPWRRRLYY